MEHDNNLSAKNKMKVVFPRMETLYFHKSYDGGAKYIHYLSEELVKKGVEVIIVTTQIRDKPTLKEVIHNGVKYVFLPPNYTGKRWIKLNAPYKFVFSYHLMKYLEKIEFDILHNTEFFAYFYLHKKNKKPVLMQTFGLEPFYGPESLSQKGLKKIYVKLFLQHPWWYCIQKSNIVASEGDFQNPWIEKLGIEKGKIISLPNAVDIKKIEDRKKKFKNVRKEFGIKKGNLLILSVCQIAKDKGIDDIINGFVMLKKEIPGTKLLMVGKGPFEKMMLDLIKKNGLVLEEDVFHRKDVSEKKLYDYYFSADIFVTASIQSDLVLCAQEAMACGLPIISAGQPMLVKNNINGYVIGPKNPRGISEGIIKVYKKGMEKMGRESKKMAKVYDYPYIVKKCIKEYEKMLKNEKPKTKYN